MPARRLPWFCAFALASTSAFAQAPTGPAVQSTPSLPEVEMDEPPPPLVPAAHDTLSGHWTAGLAAAVEAPFGQLTLDETSGLGAGYGGIVDLGFGVSRTVVVGLWGNFFEYGSSQSSFALGPSVTYHLVQGVRFDPWVLAGAGYRSLSLDAGGVKRHFAGFEFAHVMIGGDYFVFSGFGLGPWLDFDSGVFTTRPSTNAAGGSQDHTPGMATHFAFSGGLRVVLDLPGK
ncbi:MAG TPA: hypothetical protein VMI54_18170 [Polyangiaceae bacterium]|nr:hypothetical protein [Polyangiaceae bacterium]